MWVLTIIDSKHKRMWLKGSAAAVNRHHRIIKIKARQFLCSLFMLSSVWAHTYNTHTHTIPWIDAFYSSHDREIFFYFTWLLLPARQLSCYCHCYIGGTNGCDGSVCQASYIWMQCCYTLCCRAMFLNLFHIQYDILWFFWNNKLRKLTGLWGCILKIKIGCWTDMYFHTLKRTKGLVCPLQACKIIWKC